MDKLKTMLLLAGEFALVLVCCYLFAVLITLFAVGFGSVAVDDVSVWSDHVRSVAIVLLK